MNLWCPFLILSDGIAKSHVSNAQLLLTEGIGVFTLAFTYLNLSTCTQTEVDAEFVCKSICREAYTVIFTLLFHEKYHFINFYLCFWDTSGFSIVIKLTATSSFSAINIRWRDAFDFKRRPLNIIRQVTIITKNYILVQEVYYIIFKSDNPFSSGF